MVIRIDVDDRGLAAVDPVADRQGEGLYRKTVNGEASTYRLNKRAMDVLQRYLALFALDNIAVKPPLLIAEKEVQDLEDQSVVKKIYSVEKAIKEAK